MKFIEVAPGYSIKTANIDSILAINEITSSVTSGGQVFRIDIPYKTLLTILNTDNANMQEQLLKEISKKVGNLPVFAG